MTVVINTHKPYFIFKTWLWRCRVSLMHTPSSKVLPNAAMNDVIFNIPKGNGQ